MPDTPLSRREFLRVSALLGLGLGLGPVLAPLPVQAATQERLRLERTRFLMGTFVTMRKRPIPPKPRPRTPWRRPSPR